MAYNDLCNQRLSQIDGALKYLKGVGGSAPTLEVSVDFAKELNAVKNTASSEQIIQLSNALYDQVAFKRSIKETYKTAKDYYKEQQEYLKKIQSSLSFMQKDISEQHDLVAANIDSVKSFKKNSNIFHKKMSLIDPK